MNLQNHNFLLLNDLIIILYVSIESRASPDLSLTDLTAQTGNLYNRLRKEVINVIVSTEELVILLIILLVLKK